jgi:mannose-6-phosphate isomerase
MSNVYKLKPATKDYIWGGTYFKQFGKGNTDIVAECWELSVRDDFNCVLADSGQPLKEILTKDMIGPNGDRFPYFPLLIKLIDAKDNLSVQVHPSDDYALKNENSFGKS